MGYEIFEKLCNERGLKASDVAKDTRIDASTFSSWKHGRYTPKREKMQIIADYFGVSREFLETGQVESGYYLNQETAEVAQEMFETPGMRILFDAAKDSKPEDLKLAADLLRRLKETNRDE